MDANAVRKELEGLHRYFYHFTLDIHLASIAQYGLDPTFEGDDSRYAGRFLEPGNAMRYCIESKLDLGLSAAVTRNQEYSDDAGTWVQKSGSNVVVLRTPATSLLGRIFGLDHSFGNAELEVSGILRDKQRLAPEVFITLVSRFGAISCYEVIPAAELEVCRDPQSFCLSKAGEFSPVANSGELK
jgi:hypothetical protein